MNTHLLIIIIILILISVLDPLSNSAHADGLEHDVQCLALNIYHEARGESITGQIAVGYVTIHRMESKRFPNTICGVVKQRHQFSWYWDGKSDQPRNSIAWQRALHLAQALLSKDGGRIADPTHGATHYLNPHVATGGVWRHHMTETTSIGGHVFYREV